MKLAKGRPQRSDIVRSQALTDFFLSLLPGWHALANQGATLVGHFDQMAAPILVALEPQPTPSTHPLDISAERRFVHLQQFDQLGGPSLVSIGDRDQHAELAGLQSGARERAVVDCRDHPIQLAHTARHAYSLDHFDTVGHR